jgi:hypothetical protein
MMGSANGRSSGYALRLPTASVCPMPMNQQEASRTSWTQPLAPYSEESGRGARVMSKQLEGNEDWIRRERGRLPTKRAMAAERASAGLGTSDDDGELGGALAAPLTVWAKKAPKVPARKQ